jgi:hypothetical protein
MGHVSTHILREHSVTPLQQVKIALTGSSTTFLAREKLTIIGLVVRARQSCCIFPREDACSVSKLQVTLSISHVIWYMLRYAHSPSAESPL